MRVFCLVLIVSTATMAQSGKSELFGVVRDGAGLPIERASVKVLETSIGIVRDTLTDHAGLYHFLGASGGCV